jgi:hypothetical protein
MALTSVLSISGAIGGHRRAVAAGTSVWPPRAPPELALDHGRGSLVTACHSQRWMQS